MSDFNRYLRQTSLPEIGEEGQEWLRRSRVLIVGAGALGSVVGMYLAGAGVGQITVADFDTVSVSNLHRQIAYTEADVDASKADTLAARLRSINSEVNVASMRKRIDYETLTWCLADFDLVVEASDNFETKYAVTDAAAASGKPCVFGGVNGFRGEVHTHLPGGVTYRDIFPEGGEPPLAGPRPVFGPVPGIVGSIQAAEVLKILTGIGPSLSSSMLLIDTLTMQFNLISLSAPECKS